MTEYLFVGTAVVSAVVLYEPGTLIDSARDKGLSLWVACAVLVVLWPLFIAMVAVAVVQNLFKEN